MKRKDETKARKSADDVSNSANAVKDSSPKNQSINSKKDDAQISFPVDSDSTQLDNKFDFTGYFMLLVTIAVSIFTCPDLVIAQKVTINQVWYYGWITAVSTGLGVIPFYFFSEPNKFWMGISNGKHRLLNDVCFHSLKKVFFIIDELYEHS